MVGLTEPLIQISPTHLNCYRIAEHILALTYMGFSLASLNPDEPMAAAALNASSCAFLFFLLMDAVMTMAAAMTTVTTMTTMISVIVVVEMLPKSLLLLPEFDPDTLVAVVGALVIAVGALAIAVGDADKDTGAIVG